MLVCGGEVTTTLSQAQPPQYVAWAVAQGPGLSKRAPDWNALWLSGNF